MKDNKLFIDYKGLRDKFEVCFKDYVLREINNVSRIDYKSISNSFSALYLDSEGKVKNETFLLDFSILRIFRMFKEFYKEFNLPLPKSLPLIVSDSISESNEGTKDIILKRLNSRTRIKTSYFNTTNRNFLYYDTTWGVCFLHYKKIKEAIFTLFLEMSRLTISNFRINDISLGSTASDKAVYIRLNISTEAQKNIKELKTANVNLKEALEIKIPPGRALVKIFDKVPSHVSDLFKNNIETYNSSLHGRFKNFHVVKGALIPYYYKEANYTKEHTSTLHKSCMRNSDSVEFYSNFPEVLSLLIYLDSYGKIKGRALLWNTFEKNVILKGEISNYKPTLVIDRIYYDHPTTYNKYVAYCRINGIKTSYSQTGLELKNNTLGVPLTLPNPTSVYKIFKRHINYSSDAKDYIEHYSFPYLDSFKGGTAVDTKEFKGIIMSTFQDDYQMDYFEPKLLRHCNNMLQIFPKKSNTVQNINKLYNIFENMRELVFKFNGGISKFNFSYLTAESSLKIKKSLQRLAEYSVKNMKNMLKFNKTTMLSIEKVSTEEISTEKEMSVDTDMPVDTEISVDPEIPVDTEKDLAGNGIPITLTGMLSYFFRELRNIDLEIKYHYNKSTKFNEYKKSAEFDVHFIYSILEYFIKEVGRLPNVLEAQIAIKIAVLASYKIYDLKPSFFDSCDSLRKNLINTNGLNNIVTVPLYTFKNSQSREYIIENFFTTKDYLYKKIFKNSTTDRIEKLLASMFYRVESNINKCLGYTQYHRETLKKITRYYFPENQVPRKNLRSHRLKIQFAGRYNSEDTPASSPSVYKRLFEDSGSILAPSPSEYNSDGILVPSPSEYNSADRYKIVLEIKKNGYWIPLSSDEDYLPKNWYCRKKSTDANENNAPILYLSEIKPDMKEFVQKFIEHIFGNFESIEKERVVSSIKRYLSTWYNKYGYERYGNHALDYIPTLFHYTVFSQLENSVTIQTPEKHMVNLTKELREKKGGGHQEQTSSANDPVADSFLEEGWGHFFGLVGETMKDFRAYFLKYTIDFYKDTYDIFNSIEMMGIVHSYMKKFSEISKVKNIPSNKRSSIDLLNATENGNKSLKLSEPLKLDELALNRVFSSVW